MYRNAATLSKLCSRRPLSFAPSRRRPLGVVGRRGGGGCFDRRHRRRRLSPLSLAPPPIFLPSGHFGFSRGGAEVEWRETEGERASERAHQVELSTIDLSRKFVMVLPPSVLLSFPH